MTDQLPFLPAAEIAEQVRRGDRSPVDVVDAHLDRIDERDDDVNAWITVCREAAREAAREVERAVERGEDPGPLAGVPVGLKDLSAAKAGVRHTFGSRVFADNVAEETSPFVRRLEDAGAVVLGKTNLPTFGFKPKTENDLAGITSTPFDPERNAGGSSGGSAAAVADGQAALAQGGDAGGSVRIPSAFCGVFGLKPSFGRIPNPSRPDAFGAHTPFSDRGVHARTVEDAATMLEVMAGPHPRDPFSLPDDGTDFRGAVDRGVEGLSVAYSPDLGVWPVDPDVRAVLEAAVEALSDAGADVVEVDLEFGYDLETLIERARLPAMEVKTAAFAENVRDTHGVDIVGEDSDRFPDALVSRAEAGHEYDAVEFKRADVVRTELYDAIQDVFDDHDLLAAPTTSVLPFDNDAPGATEVDGTEVDPLSGWFPTWPFNLTGHPAASVPAGFADGLPVGLQVVGRRFADDDVLAAAGALERERPWADAFPPAATAAGEHD